MARHGHSGLAARSQRRPAPCAKSDSCGRLGRCPEIAVLGVRQDPLRSSPARALGQQSVLGPLRLDPAPVVRSGNGHHERHLEHIEVPGRARSAGGYMFRMSSGQCTASLSLTCRKPPICPPTAPAYHRGCNVDRNRRNRRGCDDATRRCGNLNVSLAPVVLTRLGVPSGAAVWAPSQISESRC